MSPKPKSKTFPPLPMDANHDLIFDPALADSSGKGWYVLRKSPDNARSQTFLLQSEANQAWWEKTLRFPPIKKD